jgi:hypothetical protein
MQIRTVNLMKGDPPVRTNSVLVIEPAASWQRLQHAKEFFLEDQEAQMKANHRLFLEKMMLYERQQFINAHAYQRHKQRVDQANGFYRWCVTTRQGVLELNVPRARSGCFQSQVLPRYQRRVVRNHPPWPRVPADRRSGTPVDGLPVPRPGQRRGARAGRRSAPR